MARHWNLISIHFLRDCSNITDFHLFFKGPLKILQERLPGVCFFGWYLDYYLFSFRHFHIIYIWFHLGEALKRARRIQAGAFPLEFNSSLWYVCISMYIAFLLLSKIGYPCLLRSSGDDSIFVPLTGGVFLLGDRGIVLHLSCFFHHLTSTSDKSWVTVAIYGSWLVYTHQRTRLC